MSYKVEIYCADYCAFCHKIKKYFDKNSIKYTTIDTNEGDSRERMEERCKEIGKRDVASIPQIFINDEYIGGHDDFMKIVENKNHKFYDIIKSKEDL